VSAIPDASVLELYPDEINGLKLIMAAVTRKFIGKPNSQLNMVALGNEVEGRCRDELNLEVVCDISNMELDDHGDPYSSPVLIPIKRLTPEAFDFARARYETQQGFADGNPGVITEDGRWVEPTKQIALPGGVDVAGD
jgi:hypothetical protein